MKNFFIFLIGAIVGAAIVYFLCCKSTVSVEPMVAAPKGLITPAQAMVLANAFNSRHQLISDSIVKRPDNRSSWFSLSDVHDYLVLAEKEATGLGYKMNGVRIYLGAYPNTSEEVGYSTVFFVPTGNKTTAEASMNLLNLNFQLTNPNIPGGKGLNSGEPGYPPGANYPQ